MQRDLLFYFFALNFGFVLFCNGLNIIQGSIAFHELSGVEFVSSLQFILLSKPTVYVSATGLHCMSLVSQLSL